MVKNLATPRSHRREAVDLIVMGPPRDHVERGWALGGYFAGGYRAG